MLRALGLVVLCVGVGVLVGKTEWSGVVTSVCPQAPVCPKAQVKDCAAEVKQAENTQFVNGVGATVFFEFLGVAATIIIGICIYAKYETSSTADTFLRTPVPHTKLCCATGTSLTPMEITVGRNKFNAEGKVGELHKTPELRRTIESNDGVLGELVCVVEYGEYESRNTYNTAALFECLPSKLRTLEHLSAKELATECNMKLAWCCDGQVARTTVKWVPTTCCKSAE